MASNDVNSQSDWRKKSKKKSLSDYNLYVREISSHSEDDDYDNIETESLASFLDDNIPNTTNNHSTQSLILQTNFPGNIETSDVLLTQRKVELAGVQNKKSEIKERADQNKFDKASPKTNLCIVSDKTRDKGELRQVFFEENEEEKGKSKHNKLESDYSENGIKRNFRGEIRSLEEIDNQLLKSQKRTSNRRLSDSKSFLSKATYLLNNSPNSHGRLNHSKNKKEYRSDSNKTKKKYYKRHFGLGNMEESDKKSESHDSLAENHLQALRADQFNKISPSPFEDVPGFRRSNTISHRTAVKKAENFYLPKSCSFDAKAPVIGREKWIRFEEDKPSYKDLIQEDFNNSQFSDEMLFNGCHSPTTSLLDADNKISEELVKNPMSRSVENILEVVNKAVTQLKGKKRDHQSQLIYQDDEWSEISDEIISLEFDTDEEKFCDTPVKQYPNISLFQVSNTNGDSSKACSTLPSSTDLDIGRNNVLDEYPPTSLRNSWKFWYRYPDKKKKFGSRKWIPVLVHIDNGFLKINSLNGNTPEIRKEILLDQYCALTTPAMHKGNKDGKVHSVKFQYIKFKEHRRVKPRKIEHVANYTPVVKLSCRDVIALNDFINCVETVIRKVPTYRSKSLSYEREEIFMDSLDKCSYLISGDGHVLKYNITVQIRLKCFLSGEPELKLFLNDTQNEDILSRIKTALSKDSYKRPNVWICPENYEYHSCVDENKSSVEGGVVFTPPDACTFELLRFRLRKRKPLPIVVKSSLEVIALNSVHLKAELRVNGNAKNIRYKRNNIVLYIPVPSSWSKLFVKSRLFGRNVKYLNVKSSSKSPTMVRDSNNRATFEISSGNAKYEPAYGAIVWELGSMPILKDGMAADAVQTFQCFIELPFPLHIRDDFQPYSYLEFNMNQQISSNVCVEELVMSDGGVPEKWVCYRSDFLYRIEMKILEDGKERKR